MKIILVLIMIAIPPLLFAEYVTSPLDGAAIIYQVEEGTTVKKGEILYKLQDWYYKNSIERAKLDLKIAQADLEDKKTDIVRSRTLRDKDAISIADHENTFVEYYKCEIAVNKKELEVKQMELSLEYYVFSAPYACKVTKNIISVYSGVQFGSKIMKIEPL